MLLLLLLAIRRSFAPPLASELWLAAAAAAAACWCSLVLNNFTCWIGRNCVSGRSQLCSLMLEIMEKFCCGTAATVKLNAEFGCCCCWSRADFDEELEPNDASWCCCWLTDEVVFSLDKFRAREELAISAVFCDEFKCCWALLSRLLVDVGCWRESSMARRSRNSLTWEMKLRCADSRCWMYHCWSRHFWKNVGERTLKINKINDGLNMLFNLVITIENAPQKGSNYIKWVIVNNKIIICTLKYAF